MLLAINSYREAVATAATTTRQRRAALIIFCLGSRPEGSAEARKYDETKGNDLLSTQEKKCKHASNQQQLIDSRFRHVREAHKGEGKWPVACASAWSGQDGRTTRTKPRAQHARMMRQGGASTAGGVSKEDQDIKLTQHDDLLMRSSL